MWQKASYSIGSEIRPLKHIAFDIFYLHEKLKFLHTGLIKLDFSNKNI